MEIYEYDCLRAESTISEHITVAAGHHAFNAKDLEAKIARIGRELDLMRVLLRSWEGVEVRKMKAPIVEETTQQKGDAR